MYAGSVVFGASELEQILRIAQDNPKLAEILDIFQATDQVYRETLKAMGLFPAIETKSTAHIVLSGGDSTNRPLQVTI
jgi:Ca2+-binding EF-hand superfamily protein